ncbi:proton extrusion protein PcxA [Roseofilum capinflatum]|uniref:Proton extrusion protein PxcA n=1 Tax=Roseofilum capinflatum BLCC-M114 TaxID=3022440 RepID=A0ABT7B342_9CYAN|nr:proton extrusion protein PcxA [Roseofilum capinflatum]MDJ1173555.1 proton extrusion protein PcxA [Roseofilum capinflatum BLCC-M114]
MAKGSPWQKLQSSFRVLNRWFWQTPDRALDDAYEAVLKIQAIEDEYFGGQKIVPNSPQYNSTVQAYFKQELTNNLNAARIRLSEFNTSRFFVNSSSRKLANSLWQSSSINLDKNPIEDSQLTLEKLTTIDRVLSRYGSQTSSNSKAVIPVDPSQSLTVPQSKSSQSNRSQSLPPPTVEEITNAETISDQSSFLPRTILGTFKRVQKELDPKTEEELMNRFRISKFKTIISLRFILLAFLIPLLTQQIASNFIVGPIVDKFKEREQISIFLNEDMEAEAFMELEKFESQLKFEMLIGELPEMSPEEVQKELHHKAEEIKEEFKTHSSDAVKNIFSDFFAFVAFGWVVYTSKREITVLKSFMDDLVYGLSDSAKAFIIILFTDMFVGFHSPHGWEVILEGLSRHFGLPESREFIFLFIATFPVILDTVFKYWIFRYLNRISPSSVATYKEMND